MDRSLLCLAAMRLLHARRWTLVAFVALSGCAAEPEEDPTELGAGSPLGKEDSAGIRGLPVNGDYAATQAWTVKNQWEERDTPAARQAGLAWAENSGLNWDEKYAQWVGALKKIPSSGWGDTFEINTPFEKALPAPKLDCADVALLLRASFAAWYNLPFYIVGWDGSTRVYFGHFGVRTASGPWKNTPNFGTQYRDHSNQPASQYQASWPRDEGLRKLGVTADDTQPFLNDERLGAYLDEIHLNKRAARLIRYVLTYVGTPHLATGENTYNLVPEALRTGDFLLYRRARTGSGHTMPIVRVEHLLGGRMHAEDAYGNVPPAQPRWESPSSTQRNFTSDEGGGPSKNSEGDVYARLGGGLKRFRVAKIVQGKWMNTWMAADESSWINDTDHERIAERPEQFKTLLGELSPAEQRDLLLQVIEEKRQHLRQWPASCAARERREAAFADLYQLMEDRFSQSRAEVDTQYRKLEDYVFAPLDYLHSRTCCWNSSTAAMYDIVMDYNHKLQETMCVEPVPFQSVAGSYEPFAAHAASLGRELEWRSWSEDEECQQRGYLDDTPAEGGYTPWCTVVAERAADAPTEEPGDGGVSPDAGDGGVSPDAGDGGVSPGGGGDPWGSPF